MVRWIYTAGAVLAVFLLLSGGYGKAPIAEGGVAATFAVQ